MRYEERDEGSGDVQKSAWYDVILISLLSNFYTVIAFVLLSCGVYCILRSVDEENCVQISNHIST
jgi:hypothetical protein